MSNKDGMFGSHDEPSMARTITVIVVILLSTVVSCGLCTAIIYFGLR